MNDRQRRIVTRLLILYCLFFLILRFFLYATPSRMEGPPLFGLGLDITYWAYKLSRLPQLMVYNKAGAILFDGLLFGSGILSFVYPLKRTFVLPFSLLLSLYAITYSTFLMHHVHMMAGMMIVFIPFWFADNRKCGLLWEGVRYFTCFIYTMAFIWKVVMGRSFFFMAQGITSFKANLVGYLYQNPDTLFAGFARWCIRNEWVLNSGEKGIIILEGLMVIGFFTKKWDKWLIWLPVIIHVSTYFFADVSFFELLILNFSLLSMRQIEGIGAKLSLRSGESNRLSSRTEDRIARQFFLRSWLFFLARATQMGVTFFIFWRYSIVLAKNEYGNYQRVFVICSLCASLLGLGLPLLISSLPQERTIALVRSIWKGSRRIYLALGMLIGIFLFTALPFLPWLVRGLMFGYVVLLAAYAVFELILVRQTADRFVFTLNIVYTLLFAAVHAMALYQPQFSIGWLLTGLIILATARLSCALYLFRGRQLPAAGPPTPATVRMYTHQWFFLSLNQAIEIFSANIDNLFLLWLLQPALFAVYFNGAYEIPLTGLLVSVAGTFINVQIRQYNMQDPQVLALFHKACLFSAILLFPLFFFVQQQAGPLFNLIFRGKYDDSIGVFLVSTWILPVRIANYTAILQYKLRSRLIWKGSLLGLTSKLILCPLFYRWENIRGVAAAIVVATVIQMIYYSWHTARTLSIPLYQLMPLRKLALIFAGSGIAFFLSGAIAASLPPPSRLAESIILLLLWTGSLLWISRRQLVISL